MLVYVVIGVGAALENVVPPVPADTFVLAGAFLSAAGRVDPWLVLLFTLGPNIGSAMLVYALARRWGTGFLEHPAGRWLLNRRQLAQIDGFYRRWGTAAIFVSRFLPAFRAMVPVFAGVTGLSAWRVFPPLAIASTLWYGGIVYLGALAGRTLDQLIRWLTGANTLLLVVAGLLILAFLVWWWRTRREEE